MNADNAILFNPGLSVFIGGLIFYGFTRCSDCQLDLVPVLAPDTSETPDSQLERDFGLGRGKIVAACERIHVQ
jgi:hypothetical protein